MGTDCMNDTRGMCLAELAIGIAIAILVLGGLLEILNRVQTVIGEKQRTIAQQQDVRLGLEVLEEEIRLATAQSVITTAPTTVEFEANLHGRQTNTTAKVVPGQSILPVINGSGWGKGKRVSICKGLVCETHRLSADGVEGQLVLEKSIEGIFEPGASVELNNHVVYYTKGDERGTISLMRMVDGGANLLIGELEHVAFEYRDTYGRTAVAPSHVARVHIDIKPRYKRKGDTRSIALRS